MPGHRRGAGLADAGGGGAARVAAGCWTPAGSVLTWRTRNSRACVPVDGGEPDLTYPCPGRAARAQQEGNPTMGLSWQQGPLAPAAIGRFLVPGPLPERMLFAEPLRRRMSVRFGGAWIADSDDVVLLHEPGRYPVAYFPLAAVAGGALQPGGHTTRHQDLGATTWYTVRAGGRARPRAAWQHTELPGHASELKDRVAFAWRAMDAFYEEDERIVGHADDPAEGQTFCPYKGLASCSSPSA